MRLNAMVVCYALMETGGGPTNSHGQSTDDVQAARNQFSGTDGETASKMSAAVLSSQNGTRSSAVGMNR